MKSSKKFLSKNAFFINSNQNVPDHMTTVQCNCKNLKSKKLHNTFLKIISIVYLCFFLQICKLPDIAKEDQKEKDLKSLCTITQLDYYTSCQSTGVGKPSRCSDLYMQCTYLCGFANKFGCGF
ncbi:hypothetical protein CH354_01905 [Leptospira levettii]|nr:hypothetical protein CH354_01905 [Leptospira levettii]PJZ87142.1 hypothetical protein CH368_18340 [Leptospira levettii]PKA01220.1 hypothetical protein CH369_05415 [Leptospira levettii]